MSYHRWPSNEDIDRHPRSDRCLDCRVRRFTDDPEEQARAQGDCPGKPEKACKHCGHKIIRPEGRSHWSDRMDGTDTLGSGEVCVVGYHHEPDEETA